jgi:hypothetical protein
MRSARIASPWIAFADAMVLCHWIELVDDVGLVTNDGSRAFEITPQGQLAFAAFLGATPTKRQASRPSVPVGRALLSNNLTRQVSRNVP